LRRRRNRRPRAGDPKENDVVKVNSRARLDALLADPRTVLLLLFGDTPLAKAIHDVAEAEVATDIRVPAWIRDVSLLTAAEVAAWRATEGRYAVVRGLPRRVAKTAAFSDLQREDDEPSVLYITQAFTAGA